MAAVADRRGEVGGVPAFWREAEPRTPSPVLYVHGVPTNSDDWIPFLEQAGGLAPDLPGFGRSGKPADFDYSIDGLTAWLGRFIEHAGLDRFSLLVHDWGGLALALRPELLARIDRLVSIGSNVPLGLPGYRWHRIARVWRMPIAGELSMGFTTRWGLRQASREAGVAPGPMPDSFIDSIWDHFDHGTQRAILRLYRASPPDVLARATDLGAIKAPALLLWGARDPYVPAPRFGPAMAEALGGPTRLELLEDAGHWAWIDRPDLVARAARFFAGAALDEA